MSAEQTQLNKKSVLEPISAVIVLRARGIDIDLETCLDQFYGMTDTAVLKAALLSRIMRLKAAIASGANVIRITGFAHSEEVLHSREIKNFIF